MLDATARAQHLAVEQELQAARGSAKHVAADSYSREKQLRHALDADQHVANRLRGCEHAEQDALARAEPVAPQDAIQEHHSSVLELALDQLDAVEVALLDRERLKTEVRNEICESLAEWASESTALRAKIHGAECQLRIFKDDATAAAQIFVDITETAST